MAAMLEELMSTEGERKKVLFQGRGRAIGGSDLAPSSGTVTRYSLPYTDQGDPHSWLSYLSD